MEKRKVIERISEYLQEEMAGADQARSAEIKRLVLMYRFLPARHYAVGEAIIPSSLVELSLNGNRAFYFIAPQGGGLITQIDGKAVQVITPNSPLGEVLLGKKAGEEISVDVRGSTRTYSIISVV